MTELLISLNSELASFSCCIEIVRDLILTYLSNFRFKDVKIGLFEKVKEIIEFLRNEEGSVAVLVHLSLTLLLALLMNRSCDLQVLSCIRCYFKHNIVILLFND